MWKQTHLPTEIARKWRWVRKGRDTLAYTVASPQKSHRGGNRVWRRRERMPESEKEKRRGE